MPGKVKVKILAGRNLPVMDRSSDTTDAYVEVKLGNTTYKTDVCRKSLNPQWNTEWYRFEVDDSELQDEPLQIRLMDHDTYSANDAIGKVYVDLNPLLLPNTSIANLSRSSEGPPSNISLSGGNVMSGWIPVFDTMHGIRGEVNVIVKVELFSDFNKFRQSSCGVQFFCSGSIPFGYHAQVIHGFVEELVCNDDPEYQWIDKIRTPRASNEARQTLFLKLSGEVQRKIGLKALDLGANAVIGYQQCFDFEGESGIVVRGIGTAVSLLKLQETLSPPINNANSEDMSPCVADSSFSNCGFVDHGLTVCASLPSPRLCVIPPSRNPSLSLSPTDAQSWVGLSPTRMGSRFPGLVKGKPKKKKKRAVKVVPPHLAAGSSGGASGSEFKGYNRSTQSLVDAVLPGEVQASQDVDVSPQHRGSRLSRGLRAIKLKIPAFRGKLHSDLSEDGTESPDSSSSEASRLSLGNQESKSKKTRFRFPKKHKRSNSDSMAATLILSLMKSSNLSRVVEVRESPGSSPTSPPKVEEKLFSEEISASEELSEEVFLPDEKPPSLLTHSGEASSSEGGYHMPARKEEVPILKYVDGHLISNTSSGMSSSTDSSSSSEEEVSDEYCPETRPQPILPTSPIPIPKVQPGLIHNEAIVEEQRPLVEESSFSSIENVNIPLIDLTPEDDVKHEEPLAISTPETDKAAEVFSYHSIPGGKYKHHTKDTRTLKEKVLKNQSEIFKSGASSSLVDFTIGLELLPLKVIVPALDTTPKALDLPGNFTAQESSTPTLRQQSSFIMSEVSTEVDSRATSESIESSNESSGRGVSIPPSPAEYRTASQPTFTLLDCGVDNTASRRSNPSITCALNTAPESTISGSCDSNRNMFVYESNISQSCTLNPDVVNLSRPQNTGNKLITPNDLVQNGNMSCTRDIVNTSDINPDPVNNAAAVGSPSSLPVSRIVLDVMCKSSLVVPLSPIHKSKSATALSAVPHGTNGDPSDRHGPCLIPPDRHEEAPQTDEESAHPSPANKVAIIPAIHRRSSDSDLSITPKGNSLICTGSEKLTIGNQLRPVPAVVRPAMNQEAMDMLEYPFLTMTKYPAGFILHLGGTVSSRSVKLLERITNLEEPQSRDSWWTELRMEVRSHARALGCNVVLGYSEHTSICEDVCVLSASGTAAVINLQCSTLVTDSSTGYSALKVHLGVQQHKELMTASLDRTDFDRDKSKSSDGSVPLGVTTKVRPPPPDIAEVETLPCSACHIPYSENSVPYQVTMTKCQVCRHGKVPDVLFSTIELPDNLPVIGKGCVVQAYTVKAKRDSHGEINAIEISDGLPFLEYELHRLLVNKLKVKGMNAIFRLQVQVAIGEKLLVGHATGTAVLLSALPLPPVPNVSPGKSWTDEAKLAEMQRQIQEEVRANRELYQLNRSLASEEVMNGRHSDTEDSEEELPDLDLSAGNKDTCVLEVDDLEDVEVVGLLIDPPPPEGFHVVTTQSVPGVDDEEVVRNLQMFMQVWRGKIPLSHNQQGQCQNPQTATYSSYFQGMLQSVCFKLRRMAPCALCDLRFKVQLEGDELQLSVYGMALGIGDAEKSSKFKKRPLTPCQESTKKSNNSDANNDMVFNLDEDHTENVSTNKTRSYSPFKLHSTPVYHQMLSSERYGVDLTPLSYIPGGKIERYLGNLNFFFIRESTSIKETGGLSGFVHSFVTEVLAIVRAHVTALGGNALVSYFISECVLYDSQHKNQGQCLISVGGDVVSVSYRG